MSADDSPSHSPAEAAELAQSSNESGEHLRLVLQGIIDYAVIALDPSRRVTLWNQGAEKLFGFSESEMIGQLGDILFAPEDQLAGAPLKELKTAQQTGAADAQRWHMRKDGSRFFASSVVRPLWVQGQLYGFTKVCRDLTVRRKLTAELQRQAQLLDLIHEPVFVLELKGVIRYWNQAAAQLYGYSDQEAVGCMPQDLLKTEVPGGELRLLATLEKHGTWRGELRQTLRDGRQVIVESRMVLLRTGEEQLVLVSNRDITERTAKDRALRESESRMQLAIAIAQMGTFEIDLITGAVTVNEPGRVIYGWPSTRLTFTEVQSYFHPDDREEVLRQVAATFDPNGTKEFELEQRIIRVDGAVRWIRVRGRTRFDGEGEKRHAVHCTGTYIDITKLKEAEAALRLADQRKDEFLAMLAHELRNPLAAVKNAVALQRVSDVPENQIWALEVIERQTTQLARLVDDLLDVSRITSGKIRLRKKHVDAAVVLDSAVEATQFLINERKHSLSCAYEHGLFWLEADAARLEQIVVNLLTNAAKYTDAGGKIDLRAELDDDATIMISVSDNGLGIPPEKLPEMFELFAQGERSIARSEGGLGIGLTIVKRLTELHGGTISAYSEGAGKGSMFTVRLPAAIQSRDQTEKIRNIEAHAANARGTRILVVDDNHDTADGLRRLLELGKYTVRIAHNGLEALDIGRGFQPQVIILDIGLPGMDGYTVAASVRDEEYGREALIVALTGYGQEEDRRRSHLAGIDHHFVKPVDFDELRKLLKERLE